MLGSSRVSSWTRRVSSSLPDPLRTRRAAVSGAAVLAVALTAVVVVPRDSATADALPGAAAASSEHEVLSADPQPLAISLAASAVDLPATGSATSAAVVVSAPASAHPVLQPGDTGPAVAWVQKRLGVKATGYYGPLTLAAVVAFQKAHGLKAKGYVGPATWKALTTAHHRKHVSKRTLALRAKHATPRHVSSRTRALRAKHTTVRHVSRRTRARRGNGAVRVVSAPVVKGRICPAPGATFGDGWLVQRSGHRHQGQDLMGRKGMPILAIENGYVLRQGKQGNGALTITMQGSSGSKFFYGHMEKNLVKAGQRVKRGQVIGLMGDTGSPGAVHLHFEFWKSGGESAAVNPASLLHALCG